MGPLDLTAAWPVEHVAAAAVRFAPGTGADFEVVATIGPTDHRFRLASISKPIAAWAMLVAVEEGVIGLDDPIGQPGCTLRHLLAHAGGYAFDGPPEPIIAPERKRIYSNTGIELAADAVAAAADMPFREYVRLGVLEPLAMSSTSLDGSPAHAVWSTVDDVVRFMHESVAPRVVSTVTAADALRPQYPSLGGIVPGVGRFDTCPWGLGFELRGEKTPHWTGTRNTPATYGHFGGGGTMMWVDPQRAVGVVALTDRPFDEWAAEALRRWPELSDAVIEEWSGGR